MIWPAMVFNLCVGLLFAGYLLRAVRRFERTADRIMVKLDRRTEERMRMLEHERDAIKTSMRSQVDRAIAEMELNAGNPFAIREDDKALRNGFHGTTSAGEVHTSQPPAAAS